MLCVHDLGPTGALWPGSRGGCRVAGVLLAPNYHHYGWVSTTCVLVSEEFGRVRELCAAFGTDLGVVLFASITWGEDKERVWVMRLCWVSEALQNPQPGNCQLESEDKLKVRPCGKLALKTGRPRVAPGQPAKGGWGGDRARTL